MNADAILITWGICMAVAAVIVLVEAMRGDDAKREKVMLIIKATDMTKNHNKEGTDGETNLRED